MMFDKILIANRGEIACRIIKTARLMGIRTVAVYSDADRQARHVRLADEAVYIGGAAAKKSYLDGEKIIAAALRTGAQAIHPGYGFLSENEAFCLACARAELIFIGPSAEAMRIMGAKSEAKKQIGVAGVPLTPGYHGDDQSTERLLSEADAIGYPVLIKASAGGGGKGMRLVERREGFVENLSACQREARSGFGDDHILLERYIMRARHIEIQIFGDNHGNYISLFERDCSVQRRHQKVVEEAPAPHLAPEQRRLMGEAAINAARAINYTGAGTIEFIVAPDGQFYFMEMNTRLQVEHPVTEMITGLDLVEWQLRVAAGESLPLRQEALSLRGHAIEARIYAEDPSHDFLPSTGKLVHFSVPDESSHLRLDRGFEQGDSISRFYDPMIAKLIVWDETRDKALVRMQHALAEVQIAGIANNVDFLSRLVTCPSFVQAHLDTGLIEREAAFLLDVRPSPPPDVFLFASLARLMTEGAEKQSPTLSGLKDGFRLNTPVRRSLSFWCNGISETVVVTYQDGGFRLQTGALDVVAQAAMEQDDRIRAVIDGWQRTFNFANINNIFHIFMEQQAWKLEWLDPFDISVEGAAPHAGLLAPMPGIISALLVDEGQHIEKGAPLLIVEAMKMEIKLFAPAAGYVRSFRCSVGDQVSEGMELADFEADETDIPVKEKAKN